MILNHQFHQNEQSAAKTLVFVHGLFGSLSNLGMLAREFYSSHHVLQVDVRNHGLSAHSNVMNYEATADLITHQLLTTIFWQMIYIGLWNKTGSTKPI